MHIPRDRSVAKMAAALTADQEAAIIRFVEIASARRAENPQALIETSEIDRSTAIRFLLARKFDVARALALHQQHEITRIREGLRKLDPATEPLRTELVTGKFTILPSRDATGAAIAVFTAHLHCPQASTHQTTLQGVVYQLDVALQSLETQRAGLVFIYDMSDSKYSNFDYDLSQKILMLLKGGYPAKLKKVLIVTAPLWFKAPFKILRLFVREKLRERVFTVSVPQLTQHVPRASLPKSLGGPLQVDHASWLSQCYKAVGICNGPPGANSISKYPSIIANGNLGGQQASNAEGGRSTMSSDPDCDLDDRIKSNVASEQQSLPNGDVKSPIANSIDKNLLNNASNINTSHKQKSSGSGDEEDMKISPAGHTWCSDASSQCGSASSGFSDDDNLPLGGVALTPTQLLQRVHALGRRGLEMEYNEIKARPPDGTFTYTKLVNNLPKNRYNDVLCLDQSRVLLSQLDENDPCSDYINANYVDGYKQKNAFISTQGPLPNTYTDFWRMVWEQHSLVIVMTTAIVEQGRPKCGQYWPPTPGSKCHYGGFSITNENVEANSDYRVSELLVKNIQTDETRPVSHWQFVRWPDYGVPGSAGAVLRFLERVRERQARGLTWLGDSWAGHARGPPIIVHCSAGIGRTGTFCTLDICISRLEDIGTVDVKGTVERIRSQRAYSIQMPDQYVFCHLAVIEYALEHNYLQSVDLTNFNDMNGDDSD